MIKRYALLFFLATFAFVSCKQQDALTNGDSNEVLQGIAPIYAPNPNTMETSKSPANGKFPTMEFENSEHDFGVIGAEKKVSYTFNFKNTGAADLLISNAVGSCGCTVPEYPKEPVKPGESGKIQVSFNPSGKNGNQQKSVTISANTQTGKELLIIKASITPNADSGKTSH
jgi:hypothetical protein